jgi:cephalosporin-C deacetylase
MGYTEEASRELFSYLPPLTKRADFDEFWDKTLEKTKSVPLNPEMSRYDFPSEYVEVYDISYNGFDDTRIHGWFLKPLFIKKDKYPCLIQYHGFTGDRGMPSDYMQWIMMGMAVLAVDCREQCGATGNSASYSSGATQSVVCKGVLDKNEYYYRAVYMDSVKAIDFACYQPNVDKDRIIIHGGSQGGAIGMAVCSLDPRPYLAMLDVPSNSNIERRIEGSNGSYSAVTDYLKKFPQRTDQVFETLSYFDTMNMADKIKCKLLASVGLKDPTCPAKHYFASYNRINSPKEIRIYRFNGHEGGHSYHNEVKLRFLKDNL